MSNAVQNYLDQELSQVKQANLLIIAKIRNRVIANPRHAMRWAEGLLVC